MKKKLYKMAEGVEGLNGNKMVFHFKVYQTQRLVEAFDLVKAYLKDYKPKFVWDNIAGEYNPAMTAYVTVRGNV